MYGNIGISRDDLHVDLHFVTPLNVFTGYSSSGKTFLMNTLQDFKNLNSLKGLESNTDLSDIIICKDESDIENLLSLHENYTGKTIFIDRYDYLYSDELDKFILSGKNRIVIMSHTFHERLKLGAISYNILYCTKEQSKIRFHNESLLEHIRENYI